MRLALVFLLTGLVSYIHPPLPASGAGTDEQPQVIHLTLEQAVNLALRNNRNVLAAALAVNMERISRDLAEYEFGYQLYPSSELGVGQDGESVNVGIGMRKKFFTGVSLDVLPSYGGQDNYYSGQLDVALTVPLLRGRGRKIAMNPIRAGEYQLAQIQLDERKARENMVLETISAVYQVISKEKRVRLHQDSSRRLQHEVVIAKSKEHVGLAGPLDVYRAEIEVQQAQDNLVQARNDMTRAKDSLKTLLSLPLDADLTVSAPFIAEEIALDQRQAMEIALANRIDLKKINLQLKEANRKIAIARHNLLPRTDLHLRYEHTEADSLDDDDEDSTGEQWFFQITGPTDFERKQERASLRLAQHELHRNNLNYQQRLESIAITIKNQLMLLTQTTQLLTIRTRRYEQTKGKQIVAQIKFRHGMADNFEVIQSETELQRARLGILDLEAAYIIGTYKLRGELGTLLEDY